MLPFVFFLGLMVFAVLAVLGVFIGIVVVALAIGFILFRLFLPSKKKFQRTAEDERTIILEKGEYEVIERSGSRENEK